MRVDRIALETGQQPFEALAAQAARKGARVSVDRQALQSLLIDHARLLALAGELGVEIRNGD